MRVSLNTIIKYRNFSQRNLMWIFHFKSLLKSSCHVVRSQRCQCESPFFMSALMPFFHVCAHAYFSSLRSWLFFISALMLIFYRYTLNGQKHLLTLFYCKIVNIMAYHAIVRFLIDCLGWVSYAEKSQGDVILPYMRLEHSYFLVSKSFVFPYVDFDLSLQPSKKTFLMLHDWVFWWCYELFNQVVNWQELYPHGLVPLSRYNDFNAAEPIE